MKKIIVFISLSLAFLSCKNTAKNGQVNTEEKVQVTEGAFAKSAGRINTLTVVIDNALWEGEVGDELRKYLAAPVPGLPQEEPLFTIKQMAPSAFAGFARKSRCFLRVNTNKKSNYEVVKNKYARPQIGVEISGKTNKELIDLLQQNNKEIVSSFKAVELFRRQKLIRDVLDIPNLEENFGINIRVPKAYRVAKAENDFYWIRKSITHGSMDLLVYQVPLGFFEENLSITQNIIRMRDSIGGSKVVVDEGGKFITEEAYAPFLKNTKIAGLPAFETLGTWEVKNKYMAGPFVNYAIRDQENDRYLVLEGFVFAPSVFKRDNIFELEAIIKTVSFK